MQDNNNIDHTLNSEITVLLPPLEISAEEQRALGYMPLRDDFEREYKNDAETLLSNLTINNDDDETDIDVKVALIKMYRAILLDRQRLKKIAREYGLINNASALINKHKNDLLGNNNDLSSKLKRRRDEDTSSSLLNEKFKKYAQLCNPSFYENLIENMRKRNQLISRIEELKKYRENGICTFKESEIYKEEKLKHEQDKLTNKKGIRRRSPPIIKQLQPLKKQAKPNENVATYVASTYRSTNDIDTTNLSCASSASSHDSNSIITNVSNYSSSVGSLDHNNLININRTGRSERLCSMPGYNLLSENEKKVN